jgi:hypothetical protein
MPIFGYADDINIRGRPMQTVEKMHTEFEEQAETIRLRLILRKQTLRFILGQISVASR